MSTRYCGKRVLANKVYMDYIQERDHIHMTGTVWVTLGTFVQYLGRSGLCNIDKTPKGWYVEYIDKSPEKLRREEDKRKAELRDFQQEDQHQTLLKRQVEMAKAAGGFQKNEATKFEREDPNEKVVVKLGGGGASGSMPKPSAAGFNALASAASDDRKMKKEMKSDKKRSALDDIMFKNEEAKRMKREEEEEKVAKAEAEAAEEDDDDDAPWISKGLIVKVMHKTGPDCDIYKKKGEITDVINEYKAEVELKDGTVIKLDQAKLETVIPGQGNPVRIVKGKYAGKNGSLAVADMQRGCCSVELKDGTLVDKLGWDAVCKRAKK